MNYLDLEERSSLPLLTLPPPHLAMYLLEKTYQALLGELGKDEPTVWAECLFVDPVCRTWLAR
jgi:hypothetical protein